VALTAPYMHDGSLASLEDVIDHYVRGGRKDPHQDPQVRPLSLSQAERADLVSFLQSLTDREFVDDPRFR
jgi:cytochrome c peroxidase